MIKKYILALLASVSCFVALGCFSASAYNYTASKSSFDKLNAPDLSGLLDNYHDSSIYNQSDYYVEIYVDRLNSNSDFFIYVIFEDDTTFTPTVDGTSFNFVLTSDNTRSKYKVIRYDSSWSTFTFNYNWAPSSSTSSSLSLQYDADIYILGATVPVEFNGVEYTDPDIPITVTYQPELFEGMSPNTVTYPSKQGANGQSVTSDIYEIDVSVSLTDSFLNQTTPISGSFIYSYFFTTFIVPAEYCEGEDIRSMAQHAIYTSVTQDHYLYYENETLDVNMLPYGLDNGNNVIAGGTGEAATVPVSQQWACADGATNCYVIDRSVGSKSFTIDLQRVPFENSGANSFKIVTLAHITRMSEYGWVAYPYYFKSACSELAFAHKKEFPAEFADVYNAGLDVPNGEYDISYAVNDNYTKWELYDYYTVVSDTFSYNTYPPYREQVNSDGQAFSKTPLDFRNVAAQVQDYDMHMQTGGEQEWRTESEFEDYKKMKEWGQNFATNYDVGEITGLLNGEGTFFGFITASFSVLPSWFLTILSAFFVTLLAVVVIKFLV